MFPTNKPHVSYSEVKTWRECPWRHKLIYIDKLLPDQQSPHLDYGTIVHEAIENFLKTKNMDFKKAESQIRSAWKKNGFDTLEIIEENARFRQSQGWKPKKHDDVETWVRWAKTSLSDVVNFLDDNFKEWELISAEEMLYEDLKNTDIKFKGFIDCVLGCIDKRGKKVIWVLDWKTSSSRGWDRRKRSDFLTQAQIGLYKKFWSLKYSVKLTDVKCGFVLLKKGAKEGKSCELISVSVGPKFVQKADKLVNSMISTVSKNKLFLKNRESCMFCSFYETENCR